MTIETGAAPMFVNLYIAFGVATVVVSATALLIRVGASGSLDCTVVAVRDEVTAEAGEDPALIAGLESASSLLEPVAAGFAGGNSNCEIAIATRERKRAMKKRFSIREPDRSRPT
jgi:hypothetical protein